LLPNLWAQTLSPQVREYVKEDSPLLALAHVRVIDGTGAAARDDQTIVISQGKIHAVGAAASATISSEAKVLDLRGYTVIPGIVGMHEHMFYPVGPAAYGEMSYSFPRLYLAAGVTTARTGGSIEPYTDLEIKRHIDAGKSPGPKLHVTGPYLESEGAFTPQLFELKTPEETTRLVNYWLDEGVDNFKAYNFITPAELGAAITTAHKRGAKVTGHLCSIGFRQAAALGIDNLEHGLLVDTEFFPWKKADKCDPRPEEIEFYSKIDLESAPLREMIADLVKHHVAVTSTLAVFEMFLPGRPTLQKRMLSALTPDARNGFLANKVRASDAKAIQQRYASENSTWPAAFHKEMEFERAFVKAGGLLLAGVDPTGMGGVIAGFGDQREIELLVEAGFTPVEAIQIATLNGAKYLGEEAKIGTIAAGKQADLVLIKGDPSQKIDDIENVEMVFKDGIGYDSAKLVESVHEAVGSH
jgi:imidazolonepropionase-like amidohydrolase